MTNEGADAPAERSPAQPGWGERLGVWCFAFCLSLVMSVVLGISLMALGGGDLARALSKGMGLAVFFFIIYGPHTLRSFFGYAAVCMAAMAAYVWLAQ